MSIQRTLARPAAIGKRDRISAHHDPIRTAIWLAALGLVVAAALVRGGLLIRAAGATGPPFLTLAAVIAGGLALDRLGLFRVLARVIVPAAASDSLAVCGALGFTALLSGLVNLDFAVVVAVPVALTVARQRGMHAGRLAVAAALIANASSFLLPTSNLTTLLVLARAPVGVWTYLAQSWLAWLLVTALTIVALSAFVNRGQHTPAARQATASPATSIAAPRVTLGGAALAIIDLVPMFAAASAIKALLDGGVTVHGGLLWELGVTSGLAAAANNLPAAAGIVASGAVARWAAVLGLAIGPNLLLTGSVASLISRRIAHDRGAGFSVVRFSMVGAALLPVQLLLALAGLRLTGAL